ncbi:MAG: flavodoxin [Atopobiaceae bacterium]|jgi:flavodoxin|nr:hypothetical protein [Atopobiaceae bacterium]MCH4179908.1 hypothetical protein [Atopobiaceae bacterium]MCH4213659.1 hypothetical protein [Atopobiaceae bacterium]MCH4230518.1 hypothetical protein [Atopobiaceae bacterium]MCH4275984.1 hypothetical protein [Atopobiaceae bacterium]
MSRTLVTYFTYSNGNTEGIARAAAEALGADLCAIEPMSPYVGSYDDVVEQGKEEVDTGFMPDIEPAEFDPESYDVIVVGTPTWWYTMAPPVRTFLGAHDWEGRTVVPFMTNAGWPGSVIDDMEDACPGAAFAHAKEFRFDSQGGDQMVTPQAELDRWLDELRTHD